MKNTFPRIEVPEDLRRKTVEVARQFRKEPTKSEDLLWQELRGKKLEGVKFRRQQPVSPFVVDFYASSLHLVVEVDGEIHKTQQEADRERQNILEQLGLTVLRLSADQVEIDISSSLDLISETISKLRIINELPHEKGDEN